MFVKSGGHGCGKTTAIIKRCHEYGGYIVCLNAVEAKRVFDLAKKLDMVIPLPLTAQEFIAGEYSERGVEQLWIDNADMILEVLCKAPLVGLTFTEE